MLATTDRPLRLAFVGQSTFFEACALDSGTSSRFDTAFHEFRGGADIAPLLSALAASDPDVVVVFRPEIIPAGAFAGLRATTVGFLTEPLPRTAGGRDASHEDLERRLWELGEVDGRTSTASSPSTRSSRRPPTASCRSGAPSRCRSPTATTAQ